MSTKYTTIADVINYEVAPALGEFVDDYDVEEIAREAFEYVDGYFVQREDVDFWEVAKTHDKKAAPTEDRWEGEGWYTFRTWVKTDGKYTVEDWESPVEPEPVWIESKDKLIEACKVPEGCECIVERLNSDYELRSETYNSVKKDWTPEGNYDDVPCEYLEVTITFKDEDGDEENDSEIMEITEGWDSTEPDDYERLAKILCERYGLFYDENNWKD